MCPDRGDLDAGSRNARSRSPIAGPSRLAIGFACLALVIFAGERAIARDPGTGPDRPSALARAHRVDPTATSLPRALDLIYESRLFTARDVIVFGYEDSTVVDLRSQSSPPSLTVTDIELDAGDAYVGTGLEGRYLASGDARFSVLAGDPVSNYVCGFFARDADGLGVSRELHTWVPRRYGPSRFVVFGHTDATDVSVSIADTVYASFTLDAGERWVETELDQTFVSVRASEGVSVLTAYDQGYFTPANDGAWTGRAFRTYVGAMGDEESGLPWAHDLVLIAYEDSTAVRVEDSDTGAVVFDGEIDAGARAIPFPDGADRYFTVTADTTIAVGVFPWQSTPERYHWGATVPDRSGAGIGIDFLVPAPAPGATDDDGTPLDESASGLMRITAHLDDTSVSVSPVDADTVTTEFTLNRGGTEVLALGRGPWRVLSNRILSVQTGWGLWNADFVPVVFETGFDPLDLRAALDPPVADCIAATDTFEIDLDLALDPTFDRLNGVQIELELPDEVRVVSAPEGSFDNLAVGGPRATWQIGVLTQQEPTAMRTAQVRVFDPAFAGEVHALVNVSSSETGPTRRTLVLPLCGTDPEAVLGLSNWPNPFNPATTIHFRLDRPGPTKLAIYDASGRRVAVLVDAILGQGTHQRRWTGIDDYGRRVGSGIYFYRLEADGLVRTRKMTLVE